MTDLAKTVAFRGLDEFFPDESKVGAAELVRRLEELNTSLFDQLRATPTLYTNADDDPPADPKEGDVWLNTTGKWRYDGAAWQDIG